MEHSKDKPSKQPEHLTPSIAALPDDAALRKLFPPEVIEEARRVAREQEKRSIPRE